ncbi:cyclic AMP-dependent transcription factor ATF-2-like, partial [Saccoglossus kowalevskii]
YPFFASVSQEHPFHPRNPVFANGISTSRRRRNTDDDPDERRRKFLERNRAAATRCRNKKKSWITELEKKAENLTQTNNQLQYSPGESSPAHASNPSSVPIVLRLPNGSTLPCTLPASITNPNVPFPTAISAVSLTTQQALVNQQHQQQQQQQQQQPSEAKMKLKAALIQGNMNVMSQAVEVVTRQQEQQEQQQQQMLQAEPQRAWGVNEVSLLRNEVAQLKQLLLAHKDCPITALQHKPQRIISGHMNIHENSKPTSHQITSVSAAEAVATSALTSMAHIATELQTSQSSVSSN